jgi:hypothetical protein
MINHWLDEIRRKKPWEFLPTLNQCDNILEKCVPVWEERNKTLSSEHDAYKSLRKWHVEEPEKDRSWQHYVDFYKKRDGKFPGGYNGGQLEIEFHIWECGHGKIHGIYSHIQHRSRKFSPCWLIGPPIFAKYVPWYQHRQEIDKNLTFRGSSGGPLMMFTHEEWHSNYLLIGSGDQESIHARNSSKYFGAVEMIF